MDFSVTNDVVRLQAAKRPMALKQNRYWRLLVPIGHLDPTLTLAVPSNRLRLRDTAPFLYPIGIVSSLRLRPLRETL